MNETWYLGQFYVYNHVLMKIRFKFRAKLNFRPNGPKIGPNLQVGPNRLKSYSLVQFFTANRMSYVLELYFRSHTTLKQFESNCPQIFTVSSNFQSLLLHSSQIWKKNGAIFKFKGGMAPKI